MTKLRNFTLDGKALRLIAYTDHKCGQRFNVEILPDFEKTLNVEQLRKFSEYAQEDVCVWGGLLCTVQGEYTNEILKEFLRGGEQDGVQLCTVPEG